MLYRLNKDSFFYDSKSAEKNSALKNSETGKSERVNQSGYIFLSVLSHVPQSVESLADKIMSAFKNAERDTVIHDAGEFYNGLVREGFLVCGETYADCNAMEYGYGYDKKAASEYKDVKVKAHYHLPGLFEHFELYKKFLPIFYNYREFFYSWCDIASIYGAPAYCIWNSGRLIDSFGRPNIENVFDFVKDYKVSGRFTFSNCLLEEKHLQDTYCNYLLRTFEDEQNGIIIHSKLLQNYISRNFPKYYFVSSTTKCITNKEDLLAELSDKSYKYVVPDFNFNNNFEVLEQIPQDLRNKVELLSNTLCAPGCPDRKKHYEATSKSSLYEKHDNFVCKKIKNPYVTLPVKGKLIINVDDIQNKYLPLGFCNFKLEDRAHGDMILLDEILYYTCKPEFRLQVREMMYLKSWTNFPDNK